MFCVGVRWQQQSSEICIFDKVFILIPVLSNCVLIRILCCERVQNNFSKVRVWMNMSGDNCLKFLPSDKELSCLWGLATKFVKYFLVWSAGERVSPAEQHRNLCRNIPDHISPDCSEYSSTTTAFDVFSPPTGGRCFGQHCSLQALHLGSTNQQWESNRSRSKIVENATSDKKIEDENDNYDQLTHDKKVTSWLLTRCSSDQFTIFKLFERRG